MVELTVYSRYGCHLCEEMLAALALFQDELGYTMAVYDIDEDEALRERFNALVPVVYLDGKELMRYHFQLAVLENALSGA